MRKVLLILLVLCATGAVVWFLTLPSSPLYPDPPPAILSTNGANATGTPAAPESSTPVEMAPHPSEVPQPGAVAAPPEGSPAAPAPAPASPANELISIHEGADLSPRAVLENVRSTIRQYGQMFNGNPTGENKEIARQLNGGNPRQIVFVRPDSGIRLNESGELIDSWGTPFFFHQLSSREMEIRTAGPDRTMWTPDDMVIK